MEGTAKYIKIQMLSDYAALNTCIETGLEICILCCNFTPRTVDPQDSRMERRISETRAISLHLGISAVKILLLERISHLDCGNCCIWSLDVDEAGLCNSHVARWMIGKFYILFCLRPRKVAFGQANFDFDALRILTFKCSYGVCFAEQNSW